MIVWLRVVRYPQGRTRLIAVQLLEENQHVQIFSHVILDFKIKF